MKQLKRHLPPLTSLIGFKASVHLESFTAVAEALNVSRETLRRPIRTLAAHLGLKLFERDANTALIGVQGRRFFMFPPADVAQLSAVYAVFCTIIRHSWLLNSTPNAGFTRFL